MLTFYCGYIRMKVLDSCCSCICFTTHDARSTRSSGFSSTTYEQGDTPLRRSAGKKDGYGQSLATVALLCIVELNLETSAVTVNIIQCLLV
ncbi:hypothetical protein NL676_012250 [Syzygium grande]|nr:hypothetical protein NL676_012250 [Syzygium grande]